MEQRNELDFLYQVVCSSADIKSNPLYNDYKTVRDKMEKVYYDEFKKANPDYTPLDFDEFKEMIYELCDLYAKDAFAKGIAFITNLNRQVSQHQNNEFDY